jgi:hypothetical protein
MLSVGRLMPCGHQARSGDHPACFRELLLHHRGEVRPRDRQEGATRRRIEGVHLHRTGRDPVLDLDLGRDAREREIALAEEPQLVP